MHLRALPFHRAATAALLLLLAAAGGAHAATYMKQLSTTGAFEIMGQKQPAESDTTVIWLSAQAAYMETGKGVATILRADQDKIYFVKPAERVYAEMPLSSLGDIGAMMGAEGDDAAGADQMAAIAGAMLGSVKVDVRPTGASKRIRDWNASQYMVDMSIAGMTSKAEIWASTDLKADYGLFFKLTNALQGQMPGFEKVTQEMQKVQGIPVLSITDAQVMGTSVKSTTELLECAERAAPSGIFEVPAGYAKKSFAEFSR
ncbi:MAG: hypothetical protein FJY75_05615 [Candidatus Eisenbacteria bacterium]|uniref:DUF4412 domain-containing protein n=1 Tax=Eiseniibacteriota bacterium TaxID=2212470 RepID=A0A938BQK1_UNCEI|nr:hypothetical protein [Candidatus Eisenbacteria bacterium]